jgi:hypothetical protein
MLLRSFAFLCALILTSAGAADPVVDISQSLRFGRYVLRSDNLNASLQVAYDGQVTADSAFIPVNSTARNGVIRMTGFTPNTPFDLSISFTPNPLTLSCSCPSPDFLVSNFTVETENPTTDLSGQALLRYGARITAQGGSYGDVNYSGTVTISVIVNN